MLHFQKPKTVPDYLSRREQWRLMGLVLLLGACGLLIRSAIGQGRPQVTSPPILAQADAEPAPATTTEQPTPPQPAQTAQRSNKDTQRSNKAPVEPAEDGPLGVGDAIVVRPGPDVPERAEQSPTPPNKDTPEHQWAQRLARVRDDTVFRHDEAPAWNQIFEVLENTDDETLERKSVARAQYAQLFHQPDAYRGKVVTVEGVVRGVQKVNSSRLGDADPAGTSPSGTSRHYYRLALFPAGPEMPIIVYCLALPDGFPTGEQIKVTCTVNGFFYKRWAYQAKEEIHIAPLLLARTVQWHAAALPTGQQILPLAPLLLVLVVAAVVFALVLSRARQRPLRFARSAGDGEQRSFAHTPPDAEQEQNTREFLAQLASSKEAGDKS